MEKQALHPVKTGTNAFIALVKHPLKMKLYLLTRIPAAFFSGLNVVDATVDFCMVSVPYGRFTKNPFRSTYFACLSMAAELSTGVLTMANIQEKKPAVSMLIIGMEAKFHKKAKSKTIFTCTDGQKIAAAITEAVITGESQTIKAYSAGRNKAGEVVAEFWFAWSFKIK